MVYTSYMINTYTLGETDDHDTMEAAAAAEMQTKYC